MPTHPPRWLHTTTSLSHLRLLFVLTGGCYDVKEVEDGEEKGKWNENTWRARIAVS